MNIEDIAKKMCAKGKGILAADESTGTIAKRFKSINVENLEKNRLAFRQTLFNSNGMKDYIGGVIQISVVGQTNPERGVGVEWLCLIRRTRTCRWISDMSNSH